MRHINDRVYGAIMIEFFQVVHKIASNKREQAYDERGVLPDQFHSVKLENQYAFFAPFGKDSEGFQDDNTVFLNHLYSVFHKPLCILLMSLKSILDGITILLSGRTIDAEETDETIEGFDRVLNCVGNISVAIYMLSIWSIVDTLSSVLSLVTKSIATGFDAITDNDSSVMFTG